MNSLGFFAFVAHWGWALILGPALAISAGIYLWDRSEARRLGVDTSRPDWTAVLRDLQQRERSAAYDAARHEADRLWRSHERN